MKKLFLVTVLLLFSITVNAQNFQSDDIFAQPQYMQQYCATGPDNQNKSIITMMITAMLARKPLL